MGQQPTALITGGSSGIGFAMAEELAKSGYMILLVSNQEKQLKTCAAAIEKQHGVSCSYYNLDLTLPVAAEKLYEYCQAKELDIQVLINNAGMLVVAETVMTASDRIHAILQLHMHTPVMLCRLFGEDMKKKKQGHILNVSSISSVMPYPGISLYGPSKTFLRYFTRAFRTEMKPHGVSVTCLIPGATDTALYDKEKVNLNLLKKFRIMQSPRYVAARAVKALMMGRAVCIPGLINKLIVWLVPLVPNRIISLIHRKSGWLKQE